MTWVGSDLHVRLDSNTAVHLGMLYTYSPVRGKRTALDSRGLATMCAVHYDFATFGELDQLEPGDTTVHNFVWPGWGPGMEAWFYFWGTVAGVLSPSKSAVFYVKWQQPKVYSLGILGESQVLVDNVRLESDPPITLTLDIPTNTITIARVG